MRNSDPHRAWTFRQDSVASSGGFDRDAPPPLSGFETNFDPHAGTISSAALDQQLQAELDATGEAFRREQEEHATRANKIALDARGARPSIRKLRAGVPRKTRSCANSAKNGEGAATAQLDRVARQAEELEEKLARLTTNIPSHATGVVDPEGTLVDRNPIGASSVAGMLRVRSEPHGWKSRSPTTKRKKLPSCSV